MDLILTTTAVDGHCVVGIEGELDVFSAAVLDEHFLDVLRFGPPDLVVDLEGVRFIDSSGLNVLYGVGKRTRTFHGSLRLVCSRERAFTLFRMTGPPRDLPTHDTLQEATATRRCTR